MLNPITCERYVNFYHILWTGDKNDNSADKVHLLTTINQEKGK